MTEETYEHHKQQIADGKIAVVGGRTAASVEQLDLLRRIDGQVVFGSQSAAKPGEVLAIDSGRLSPEDITALGTEHPLVVAAQRLTTEQLDGLVDYVTQPLLDELKTQNDELQSKTDELQSLKASASAAAASGPAKEQEMKEQEMTLSEDPREQGVQAQMATGATDNISPKTVLDNKTDATTPAGKNASKAAADTAQDQEKAAAKNGS